MFKIKDLIKNKTLVMLVKLVIAIFICYLFLSIFRKCNEGFEGRKELLLLHMDGCPHCVTLMPHWEAAKSENKTKVVMTNYERSDKKGAELCKKHNVTGFPTILLLNGENKKDVYKGERSKGAILNYLKSL